MTARFDNGLSIAEHLMLSAAVSGMLMISFPTTASAQTADKTRLVFEIKNLQIPNIPTYNQLANNNNSTVAKAAVTAQTEQIDANAVNAQILREYLTKKGSPLADHADVLIQQENWKLVLAISNGESTLCKKQRGNNCWGIGGAWNLKQYDSFSSGIVDVNRIITDKYVAKGLNTPEKIVNRYVGHPNANWVMAVNKILNDVNALPLVN